MTTRQQMSNTKRAQLFNDHKGICHICSQKITVGQKWEVEHIIPIAMANEDGEVFHSASGEYIHVDDLRNKAPAHVHCHKPKTKTDMGDISKAERIKLKHIGAWKSKTPLGGGKFRKKMSGKVELRNTGEEI